MNYLKTRSRLYRARVCASYRLSEARRWRYMDAWHVTLV
jgi:hypothetical protein